MPSHEANKETVHYGDSLLLLNQYAIPDTSATAGYLDKYGGDDGEKTYDGVRTSQDPDRANGSGTWKLEPIDSGSGPLKYGHKFRLVNQHVEAGYLEAFNGGEDIVVFGGTLVGRRDPLVATRTGAGVGVAALGRSHTTTSRTRTRISCRTVTVSNWSMFTPMEARPRPSTSTRTAALRAMCQGRTLSRRRKRRIATAAREPGKSCESAGRQHRRRRARLPPEPA